MTNRFPELAGLLVQKPVLAYAPVVRFDHHGYEIGQGRGGAPTQLAPGFGRIADQRLLDPREGIPELMAASDLMVHPARLETTGTVIMEALVNGLPQVTSANCGYAVHVQRAAAGIVLDEPFSAWALEQALAVATDPARRAQWSANGIAYGADPELYRGIEHAAEFVIADAAR